MDSMNTMNTQNAYEQEIDLKDLLFAILRKWKPIIASMVIFAVLIGGAKGVLTYRNYSDPEAVKNRTETYETEQQQYEDSKNILEREIKNITDDIANRQDYMENSLLMNMSPYDVGEARADLFIKTDYEIMPGMTYQNIDYTNTILQSYQSLITSTAFLEHIARSTGMKDWYLQELITVERGNTTITGTNISELTNLLTIRVKHSSVTEAEDLLDDILKQVGALSRQINGSIGEHTVDVISRSSGSIVDLALATKQKEERERLDSLESALVEKETALKELKEPEMNSPTKMVAVKSAIKYSVLGAVLGAFMIIFIVCVFFVMSDKLYSSKELRNRFRVKVLGELSQGKKAGKIDALIDRLEGKAASNTADVEYEVIAANIKNYTDGIKTLLVSGTAAPDFIVQVVKQLAGHLPGMQIVAGGNILQDAETIRKLSQCDGVVLVEQCGLSTYQAIGWELEKICDLKKEIIGTIIVGRASGASGPV